MSHTKCPLCSGEQARKSWLGSIYYAGREFPYVECVSCGSLYCNPMPAEDVLSDIYGLESLESLEQEAMLSSSSPSREPSPVINFLRGLEAGTFIDYGCGYGSLLKEVEKQGWQILGIEFDIEMADFVRNKIGLDVIAQSSDFWLKRKHIADVLHLGDVLEHLTRMDSQLPDILNLIKPGGYLIATGPLENNFTLFNLAVRSVRSIRRRWRQTEMAPRHVMLATAQGQRRLFQRYNLREVQFSISEVSWPAPSSLSLEDIKSLRKVGLFTLSRLSRAASSLNAGNWGNRYFYIGQV